jgi:hypothetical protein
MNFLAPLFLVGGLAIAAPILFHLVRKATRDRTRFSSLMFLQPSPPRLSRRHRLEHLLLLLLRCLALALLALGFARPFLRQSPVVAPAGAPPQRIAVLLDTSASMRRSGLWDAARARVEDVLRRAGPNDQVTLLAFDQGCTAVVTLAEWTRTSPGDRVALVQGRLATLGPSWAGTRLGNALVTAAEALAEEDGTKAPGPRRIFLVSDLQAGSRLDALQAYEWPKGIELLLEPVQAARPTNAGLQLLAEGPDSPRGAEAPVRVRVTNAADSKREQFKLGWTKPSGPPGGAGEFLGSPLDAYVPPGQSRVIAVPRPAEAASANQLTLRGDDEDFDNTVYHLPPVQQKPTVLWVGADAPADPKRPLFFLRRAWAETPRVAVRLVNATAAALNPADVAAASLILVSGAVPTETAAGLRAQAEAGKLVVFVPDRAEPAAGATLGVLAGTGPVALEEVRPSSYAMLADINFQHPLFAPFADPRFSDFSKIRFWRHRRLDVAVLPGARVVASFDGGAPAVVELPVGQGRLVVLASGWHPDDSQLAVSSKFVPLAWSLLELAGGLGSFATQHAVGDVVPVPAGGAAAVRDPAGVEVPLAAGAVDFRGATRPGVHAFVAAGREIPFAVNLDPNESRTTPLGPDELEALGVPVAKSAVAPGVVPEAKLLPQAAEAENRQKLWRWFLVATLAVLLAETALAGWTARRATLQSTEETA